MPPVHWEMMAYLYLDVGINDDNFGMACVMYIGYLFSVIHGKTPKIYGIFLYRLFILIRMIVFM